jgi:hypothetical protein
LEMNLVEMRAKLRRDLRDEDAQNYRWSDEELDRHIERAVRELSLSLPLQAVAALTATAGSRDINVSGLADLVLVEAVEYPVGEYPPAYVRFSLWGDILTLLTEQLPGDGEQVHIYYGKLHTLDESGSSLPKALEDLVATGAAGYAAIEWASFAINRVNVAGEDVWRSYLVWGQDRLSAFMQALAKQGRRSAVRVRQLYSPYREPVNRSTDWGP